MSIKIAFIPLGIFLIYCSVFLYENHERKISNRLEEFWIRIDDDRIKISNLLLRFLIRLTHYYERIYDITIESRILSLDFIIISTKYSVASFLFCAGVLYVPLTDLSLLWKICSASLLILSSISLARLKLNLSESRIKTVYLILLVSIASVTSLWGMDKLALFFILFLFSCINDMASIYLARSANRNFLSKPSILRGMFIYVVSLLVILMILLSHLGVGLLSAAIFISNELESLDGLAQAFTMFLIVGISFSLNIVGTMSSSLVVFSPLVILGNFLVWHPVERVVYFLQKVKILNYKKVLFAVGCLLIAFGWGNVPAAQMLNSILQIIGIKIPA